MNAILFHLFAQKCAPLLLFLVDKQISNLSIFLTQCYTDPVLLRQNKIELYIAHNEDLSITNLPLK
jgi:hypothetical protein